MRAFARQQGIDRRDWHFLSPEAGVVEGVTRDLGFSYAASAGGFDHLTQVTLLDADGRVAAQVYGENFDVPMLVGPLKALLTNAPLPAITVAARRRARAAALHRLRPADRPLPPRLRRRDRDPRGHLDPRRHARATCCASGSGTAGACAPRADRPCSRSCNASCSASSSSRSARPTPIFGERLNPLYHLGALSYWLFWVVVASGLYLYAFFDTSVTGAYASVERLTHEQRWVGGILSEPAPLRLRRHGAHDGAAPRAPLRLRPPPRLPLVLLGERRGRPLARLRLRHQRLHAAVGPAGAVHRRRDGRVVRRAARLQRPADAQLPRRRQRERPLLLAALLPAHRPAAGRAGAPLDPHPPRAAGEDPAAARADGGLRRGDARRCPSRSRRSARRPRTSRRSPRASTSTGSTCRPTPLIYSWSPDAVWAAGGRPHAARVPGALAAAQVRPARDPRVPRARPSRQPHRRR